MASETTIHKVDHLWPDGTEVAAYPRAAMRAGAEPLAPPLATAKVKDGTVTFAGLTPGQRLTAHAEVDGRHIYIGFAPDVEIVKRATWAETVAARRAAANTR